MVCIVTDRVYGGSVDTTYLNIGKNGTVTKTHERAVADICFDREIKRTKWIPFFDSLFISDINMTFEHLGMISIDMYKFGDDGDTLYPFGDAVGPNLPEVIEFEYDDSEGKRGTCFAQNLIISLPEDVRYPVKLNTEFDTNA